MPTVRLCPLILVYAKYSRFTGTQILKTEKNDASNLQVRLSEVLGVNIPYSNINPFAPD